MAETKALEKNQIDIMIIEDDDVYRESIQELINECEKLVCQRAYESCEDGIAAIEEGFAPEIILIDIDLPGMNGIEGIQHFKRLSPASRSVMLTVFDDDDKIFNAICYGASGYLLKSASSENICQYMEDVMKGGAVMNPHIAAKVLKMFTQYSQPKKEYGLTRREKEILQLLVNGMNKKHIAGHLSISLFTVDTHLKNIYAKLHVHSQIDVVAKAIRERLI